MKQYFQSLKIIIFSVLIFLPVYMIIKTDFPTVPTLTHNISLCQGQSIREEQSIDTLDETTFTCLHDLSIDTLYSTKSVKVKVVANQSFNMRLSFRFMNNEYLSSESQLIQPKANGSAVTVIYHLETKDTPKLNRLVHYTHELAVIISQAKKIPLKIKLVDLSLQ